MKGFQDEAIYLKQSISFKRKTNISIFIALIKPLKEGEGIVSLQNPPDLWKYTTKRGNLEMSFFIAITSLWSHLLCQHNRKNIHAVSYVTQNALSSSKLK